MPDGYRTVDARDLIVNGGTATAPDGSWQAPLTHLLWHPMLVAGVQTFKPFPVAADGHGPRITVGRAVWRRETFSAGPPRPHETHLQITPGPSFEVVG